MRGICCWHWSWPARELFREWLWAFGCTGFCGPVHWTVVFNVSVWVVSTHLVHLNESQFGESSDWLSKEDMCLRRSRGLAGELVGLRVLPCIYL